MGRTGSSTPHSSNGTREWWRATRPRYAGQTSMWAPTVYLHVASSSRHASVCRAPDAGSSGCSASASTLRTCPAGSPLLDFAVDDGRGPEPPAAAHRLQPVARIATLQLVEQPGHQDRARRAERMADGDGATVDVRLREVCPGFLLPGEDDRGERLVDLE